MPKTPDEVDRLRRVYQSYRQSDAIQARRSDTNPGNRAIHEERESAMREALAACEILPFAGHRILEVGCGSGAVLGGLAEWGVPAAALHGVDLLPDRIAEAKREYPDLEFDCMNAEELTFADASFDLVLVFTVFSSILDERMARNTAREIFRVLKPGGFILWYDFRYNNPNNPHVRGMTRDRIRRLFPEMKMQFRSITLLPVLARRLGRFTTLLYPSLARIPSLRTHYLAVLAKPSR